MKELTEKTTAFRAELCKIMPGFTWTINKPLWDNGEYLHATGIISSGFSRTATLSVIRRENFQGLKTWYEVKSAGYGTRAMWAGTRENKTLASALRDLQNYYEHMAAKYSGCAGNLQHARTAHNVGDHRQEE